MALGGTGAERPGARLLRRWRRALSACCIGWLEGLDISLRRAQPAARHGARRVSRHRPGQGARTGRRLPQHACRGPRPHCGAQREACGGRRRGREGDDIRRLCNCIHQRPRSRVAKPEASPAVEEHARHLREPGGRQAAGVGSGYRARTQGARTHLDQEARDGLAGARAHGSCARLGQGARLSHGREPGQMARAAPTGETRARWRGPLTHLLPAKTKVRKVEHPAALPYARIGAFLAALRKQDGISARALEFLVLTATRTGETLGATWNEVDMGAKLWTIPAGRMKAGKEHRGPLSDAALAVLQQMHDIGQSDSVFPGGRDRRPLSETSLLMLLRRMGHGDITAHGFRSTFRDWAAERTSFPREVAEMALAHAIPDA